MMQANRVESVHNLRGIAALGVAWYHFNYTNTVFQPGGLLTSTSKYGWLGVQVFFVISGFILPYALHHGGYGVPRYFRFVAKRMVRLEPPYLASIVLVLVLGYLASITPGFRGQPFSVSPAQLALHLGYLNGFFGYEYINGPYWTLAIEFQWYLLVGLIYPAIVSRNESVRFACLGALVAASLVGSSQPFVVRFVPLCSYMPLFLIGVVTFHLKVGRVGMAQYLTFLALLLVVERSIAGTPETIAGLGASLMIAWDRINNVVCRFLGDISYSLYLIHEPIGNRLLNLSTRYFDSAWSKVFLVLLATSLSIACAFAFYRFIERPAQKISNRIRYRRREGLVTAPAPA
jgi:peptidoglycan/LPS O-acetylase OafA/YrhL